METISLAIQTNPITVLILLFFTGLACMAFCIWIQRGEKDGNQVKIVESVQE